jgi:hypothetical protein
MEQMLKLSDSTFSLFYFEFFWSMESTLYGNWGPTQATLTGQVSAKNWNGGGEGPGSHVVAFNTP